MELPEIPREQAEERVGIEAEDPGKPEADTGLYLEIPITPEDPVVAAVLKGIHQWLQWREKGSNMKTRRLVLVKEMLDAPLA